MVEYRLAKARVASSNLVSRFLRILLSGKTLYHMREWLSGGAPPCQGGGRGFDPRLALFLFLGKPVVCRLPSIRFPDFHEPNIYTYSLESTFADRAVYRTGLRC